MKKILHEGPNNRNWKIGQGHYHTTKLKAWQQSRFNETKINFKVLYISQRNIYYRNKCEQPSEVPSLQNIYKYRV